MSALTWKAARLILRQILVEYLDGPPPKIVSIDEVSGEDNASILMACMDFWLRNDLDLYVGALALSVALLVLAVFAHVESDEDGNSFMNAAADASIYHSQLAASIFLVISCMAGSWMVRRRQFACSRDVDSVKRREIKRFLRSMERKVDEKPGKNSNHAGTDGTDIADDASSLRRNPPIATPGSEEVNTGVEVDPLNLPGTSLTGIYNVNRVSEEGGPGQWSRIPTGLLVKGDLVALSIGDMAPSKCRVVNGSSSETSVVEGSERVSLEYLQNQPTIAVPKGRTTLPPGSRKLLELCNSTHIFELLESPLEGFLRRPLSKLKNAWLSRVPYCKFLLMVDLFLLLSRVPFSFRKMIVKHKVPLILRQLQAIRASLSVLSLFLLIITAVIIVARPGIATADISFILSIPFLASLGVLPIGAPAFLIFLEIFGTARILAAAHPHSSFRQAQANKGPNAPGPENSDVEKDGFPLLARYIFATMLSRLDLKEFARDIRLFFRSVARSASSDFKTPKVIRVPPASVYLLEKLGVATAFTMVDDELACEPHALPQQLLIPSGKGLKLLDMCPTYEDESGDDESTVNDASGRRRGRSFEMNDHDSDSDSDTAAPPDIPVKRQRKKLFQLRRKRKRNSNSRNSGEAAEHALPVDQEVQFEDPNWWQHLPALKVSYASLLLHVILSHFLTFELYHFGYPVHWSSLSNCRR